MIIEITDHTTIRQIQEVFSGRYPYLAIHFFNHPPGKDGLYERKNMLPADKPLRDIRKTHVSALLEIRPLNTIAAVEKELWNRWGLCAQVLRQYDTHWIIPEKKDSFTLLQQNEQGAKDAAHIVHPAYDTRIEDNEY